MCVFSQELIVGIRESRNFNRKRKQHEFCHFVALCRISEINYNIIEF